MPADDTQTTTEDDGGGDPEPSDSKPHNKAIPLSTDLPAITTQVTSPKPPISVAITVATPPISSVPPAAPPGSHTGDVQSWVAATTNQGPPSSVTTASKKPERTRKMSDSSQKMPPDIPPQHPRPPSTAGSHTDGRFSLKDLLNGPKLTRRNSASSRKSVSSRPPSESGKAGGSSAGESALESKYGIYGKMAIGKGATSVVRLAHKWDRTEEKLYAVKEFRARRKNESQREYVKKLTSEFCISSTLRHPNVVETVDLLQDQDDKWCEVMEFCPGGDLYAAIRRGSMSPAEVECCFKQLLTGVAYIHSQGVAHRDLKPENMFFDARGQLKIGDYGASTVFRLPWEQTVHKSSGLCGSEPYIAPEQFAHPASYDARLVDIWACGIIYYCLHFQELPWSSAQPTDKIYASYVTQCASAALSIANIPFLPKQSTLPPSGMATPISSSGPGTPARQDSSGAALHPLPNMVAALRQDSTSQPARQDSVMSTTSTLVNSPSGVHQMSRAERDKEIQKEQATPYPTTIQHLSPRACRPVLRRMLEPKPELRVGIEDIMRHPWVISLEVCIGSPNPKHIHSSAIAFAAAGGVVHDKS